MGELSIFVGQHRLSLADGQALFINGQFVQIESVSQKGIILLSQIGQKYQISGQDFYRLIAGGVEPDKKLVGELMAKDMMHRQWTNEPEEQPKQYKVKRERLVKG